MATSTHLWKDQFNIEKTKVIKALGKYYIIFSRNYRDPGQPGTDKRGLYFAVLDFIALENDPNTKLTDIIRLNVKPIFEFGIEKALSSNWDAKGNDKILAVAFSIENTDGVPEDYTTKLMALTNSSDTFNVCDTFDHDQSLNSIEVVIPFPDKERAHAIYGSNGLYYSKH